MPATATRLHTFPLVWDFSSPLQHQQWRAGSLTQDVMHRIVPNWSAAALLVKNNKVEETVQNPRKMMMAGSVVGALVVIFLNTMASIIPGEAFPDRFRGTWTGYYLAD